MSRYFAWLSEPAKQMLLSWLRVFAAASLTVYLTDPNTFDPQELTLGGIVAVGPVILRWLNPNDVVYGRGSDVGGDTEIIEADPDLDATDPEYTDSMQDPDPEG